MRPSRQSGLTLVEVLVAAGLLGTILAALASWTHEVGRATAELGPRLRWERAAGALMRRIHDDLATGDLSPHGDETGGTEPRRRNERAARVRLVEDRLVIQTRRRGEPCRVTYALERRQATIVMTEEKGAAPRPVLGEVESLDLAFDEERALLDVTLVSRTHQRVARRFLVPFARRGARERTEAQDGRPERGRHAR